jgi:DNase/tRNase domain of colicin-like bacteriocin
MANSAYSWSPMSPKFSIDFAQGVGDWGVGLIEATPMLVRLTPQYGMFDPAGQREQQQQLADGLAYAWDHPGDTLKAVTGWNHVENGEPGRMAGQAAPDVLLAFLSGGGSVAAKTASTSSKVMDFAEDASTLRRAAAGGAALTDDVVRSGRVPEAVVHDAQGRLLIQGRPPNNAGIFPGVHEKTQVPFTQEGFPDFYGREGAVHVDAPNAPEGRVEIVMKGNRTTDFVAADRAAGIDAAYRQRNGLTWHHLEDCRTMVLVDRTIHDDTGHHGAVSLFKAGICK